MRTSKTIARAVAVAGAGIALLLGATATPAHAAGTVHGCPSGYACIYPQDAGWNNDHPSQKYYTYGTYQLSNMYGTHYIVNNQTGGAKFFLCTDSYGKTCPWMMYAGNENAPNLTPINSVVLVA